MREQSIPRGFCQCGCGQRTGRYKSNAPERGAVKGEFARYLTGHHLRKLDHYVVEDRGFETPCWVWKLSNNGKGYGRLRVPNEDRKVVAHRWYYEQALGPVPEGLQLDHLCRVPACVNPQHLEPVTSGENQKRGWDARKAGAPNQLGVRDARLARARIRNAFDDAGRVRSLRSVREDSA